MNKMVMQDRVKAAPAMILAPRFAERVGKLQGQMTALVQQDARYFASVSEREPQKGVYLFSDSNGHQFVGRTNRLYQRMLHHCRGSSSTNRSSFKLCLLTESQAFGRTLSRKTEWRDLEGHPAFREQYEAVKDRINRMQIRFIEESDSLGQLLLEIYCKEILPVRYAQVDLD